MRVRVEHEGDHQRHRHDDQSDAEVLHDGDDTLQEWFDSYEYARLRKRFEPKPRSYKAQILYGGANQLADAFLVIGKRMFPSRGHRGRGQPQVHIKASKSLWKLQLEKRKRNNPHITNWSDEDGGKHLVVVVPKYKYILDLVRNHCYQEDGAKNDVENEISPASIVQHFELV